MSSHGQRTGLARRGAEATQGAIAANSAVDEVVTEVGSGLNGRRRRLTRLLAASDVSTVGVAYRGRLARFGVEHVEAALAAHGRRVVVVDDGEVEDGLVRDMVEDDLVRDMVEDGLVRDMVEDDLVRDMVEALTLFCARLCGRRGARGRAEKALRCAQGGVGPASREATA